MAITKRATTKTTAMAILLFMHRERHHPYLYPLSQKNISDTIPFFGHHEDSDTVKPHPVIFIDANSYTILQLSSKTEPEGYIIKDWKEAGLEKPSVIRTDRRVILKESDVKSYIGVLTERDLLGFLTYLREHPSHHQTTSLPYTRVYCDI